MQFIIRKTKYYTNDTFIYFTLGRFSTFFRKNFPRSRFCSELYWKHILVEKVVFYRKLYDKIKSLYDKIKII